MNKKRLHTLTACEINTLINLIEDYTSKSYDQIIDALFETNLYPHDHYIELSMVYSIQDHWVKNAIQDIMNDNNIYNLILIR